MRVLWSTLEVFYKHDQASRGSLSIPKAEDSVEVGIAESSEL
jgi:hypothetical protein